MACLKVFLVVRSFSEIPGCQLCLLEQVFITGAANRSKADAAMPKSQIEKDMGKSWEKQALLKNILTRDETAARSESRIPMTFLRQAQKTSEGMWTAWHCSDSVWSVQDMNEMTARRDFYFPTINSRAKDSRLAPGQIGTGAMRELNARVTGLLRSELSADKRLGPMADKLLRPGHPVKAFGLRLVRGNLPQDTLVTMVLDLFRAVQMRRFKRIEKIRGSVFNAPRQTRPGLLWTLVSTVLLMLNASRPVSEALGKARSLSAGTSFAVMLHGALDTSLLVATLVVASAASPAAKQGKALHHLVHQIHQLLYDSLAKLVPEDINQTATIEGRFFEVLGNFVAKQGVSFLHQLDSDVRPAVAMATGDLIKVGVGILIFMGACSTLAALLAPKKPKVGMNALLDVGLTGPLRFLMGTAPEDWDKFFIFVPVQICLRGLLCSVIAVLMWQRADDEHVRTWYAMVFNDSVENSRAFRIYAVLVSVHCASGLVAYFLLHASAAAEHAESLRLATRLQELVCAESCKQEASGLFRVNFT